MRRFWRNLDWLPDADKVLKDVSGRDHLAAALNGAIDSPIAGGKRYNLATPGRRSDTQRIFDSLDIIDFVGDLIMKFEQDVRHKLAARLGRL